ncbi:[protein release factor]-glutamine N5-methyltransferase [Desulfacinum hydrothermale DSM 13146]|uniref:Release factor glutamine methyltransferase n=1 Tax=Desulfacinum hydrothermale DSM 13146 TaxID=1121390 RepID=A0A1W1XQT9_9BACT|nr:peptide chain release factor N(5)-glutamine methyltransferase [Desulfacinum hydrothermale]SMC26237.1 [protein release factor]-glutamine N5-methyltransferase [Desulfacinum hydrothermale DSM 13146]
MEETWTILKVLQWTTQYFRGKGLEQPRADAEVLLAHALGLRRVDLYLRFDQPLHPDELARYRELIKRRTSHEPTQYITGRQEFWSLELEVNPAVLIPRPETERLVELALEAFEEESLRVLDVGTGSGAIAIALATERPGWAVTACDISLSALKTARRNARRHGVADRIAFVASDLTAAFRPSPPPFHLICANPPYVGDAQWDGLAPEVTHQEPETALRGGGPQGTHVPRKLLRNAFPLLLPGGMLLMEFGQGQEEVLAREARQLPEAAKVEVVRDYAHIPRILCVTRRHRGARFSSPLPHPDSTEG